MGGGAQPEVMGEERGLALLVMLLLLLLLLLLLTSLRLLQEGSQGPREPRQAGWGCMDVAMVLRVQGRLRLDSVHARVEQMARVGMMWMGWVLAVGVMETMMVVMGMMGSIMVSPKTAWMQGREAPMGGGVSTSLSSIQVHAHFRRGTVQPCAMILQAATRQGRSRPQVQ